MTVVELIEKLKELPQDLLVLFEEEDRGDTMVGCVTVLKNRWPGWSVFDPATKQQVIPSPEFVLLSLFPPEREDSDSGGAD